MSSGAPVPELVVAGNLLVDDIVFADGRTLMGEPGGGALYVSLAAALWGVRVGLVSLLGDDYPVHAIEALRARGVDLTGVHRLHGPALRTWLLYEKPGRQIVHQLGAPGHDVVSPKASHVPPWWLDATLFHSCPVPFAIQRALIAEIAQRGARAISLDPHETVRADNLADWSELFAKLDFFFVSHEEVRLGAASSEAAALLRDLHARPPRRGFLLKRGAEGGLLFDTKGERVVAWKARAVRVIDATGAGDAFAGGFLAGWLKGDPFERALQRGVVSASFAIAAWGPRALIEATPADAKRRLSEWYGDAA